MVDLDAGGERIIQRRDVTRSGAERLLDNPCSHWHPPSFQGGMHVTLLAHDSGDCYKVDRIAPGHCTGEPAFYHFKRTWGERYTYAGVGSRISLP